MTGPNFAFFLLFPHGLVYKGLPSACGLHRFLGCLLGHHFIMSCFQFFFLLCVSVEISLLLCGRGSCLQVFCGCHHILSTIYCAGAFPIRVCQIHPLRTWPCLFPCLILGWLCQKQFVHCQRGVDLRNSNCQWVTLA